MLPLEVTFYLLLKQNLFQFLPTDVDPDVVGAVFIFIILFNIGIYFNANVFSRARARALAKLVFFKMERFDLTRDVGGIPV